MSVECLVDIPRFKDKIDECFIKPDFAPKHHLFPVVKRHAPLVDSAFCYVFKFYLAYWNKDKVFSSAWIADSILENPLFKVLTPKADYTKILDMIAAAKNAYENFMKTGELTEPDIKALFRLGMVDSYYRNGELKLPPISAKDLSDLKHLINLLEKEKWIGTQRVILDPGFNEAGYLVESPACDTVFDDLLFYMDNSTRLVFDTKSFRRLAVYYTLYRIGGICSQSLSCDTDLPISRLGLYYSLFGVLYSFNVEEIISENVFDQFARWFIDACRHEYINDPTVRRAAEKCAEYYQSRSPIG